MKIYFYKRLMTCIPRFLHNFFQPLTSWRLSEAISVSMVKVKVDILNTLHNIGRCVEYGIDYHGNDVEVLHNINLVHWSHCAKQCLDHSACSFWTFKVADNICALKSSDAGWEKQDNTMSGSSNCLSEC